MLSPAQIDDIKRRADLPALAQDLGASLRRRGAGYIGSCPMCGGGKRATRFEIKNDGWVCAVCQAGGDALALVMRATGCDFRAAAERLGGARLLSEDEEARLARRRAAAEAERARTAEAYRQREIAAVGRIWARGQAPSPAGAAGYLARRGCRLPGSALLREIFDHAYCDGAAADEAGRAQPRVVHRGPAMLAAILDNSGAVCGLHQTWFDPAGGKAAIFDPETGEVLPAKKVRGVKTGGHIVLRDGGLQPARLYMGEGIETVLSVATALARVGQIGAQDAFWSSVDLGNLGGAAAGSIAHPSLKTPKGRAQRLPGPDPDFAAPAIAIPDSVRELVLLGDGDSEAVLTQTTLERARRRYARPGLHIGVAMAPDKSDFNDVLRGQE